VIIPHLPGKPIAPIIKIETEAGSGTAVSDVGIASGRQSHWSHLPFSMEHFPDWRAIGRTLRFASKEPLTF
jgi:hypothetical protein